MGCTVQPRFGITRREGDASRLCASMIVFLASALAHGRRRSIGKDHGARLWAAQRQGKGYGASLRAAQGECNALAYGRRRASTLRSPTGGAAGRIARSPTGRRKGKDSALAYGQRRKGLHVAYGRRGARAWRLWTARGMGLRGGLRAPQVTKIFCEVAYGHQKVLTDLIYLLIGNVFFLGQYIVK